MTTEHVSSTLTLEHLWQFSLQYYGVREVKEACLNLQNQFHGNVNLLLLLKLLDEQSVRFQSEDWHLVQSCLGRTEQLLHQYRDIRRQLKHNVVDSLYREALEFELSLEKQQQSDLVDCINSLALIPHDHEPLVLIYCRQLGAEHLGLIFAKPISELPTR
ncbi:TIGR02444 family protein [Vibrio mediterranei]|uniref:TIGR02444 family protein n=1 Tax=Vibrio mediterranei TaxID=689 RepID=A0ABX5DDH9_9VIBR|nr:TIGR02444 family protein [Vibrio mediterranei]PCD87639.1 TIGR02444 family protein [Vibrio mediterranei]PRQ67263.1 TIGR02444 family protein [Vibrio mediterranei]